MSNPRAAADDGRSAIARASDARPFKPYVYRGGEREPGPVIAARERWRAMSDAVTSGEAAPDTAPGYEWKRELDDEDEIAERGAAAEVAAKLTERGLTPQQRYDLRRLFDYGEDRQAAPAAVPEPGPLPAPPPVTAASRCEECGYLTTAAGHKVMCGE